MKKKQAKLFASRAFSPEFSEKVDMAKVSLDALRPWVERKITTILGNEDEIVYEYCIAQLEAYDPVDRTVDPREVQINLEGFLGEPKAAEFMRDLWILLLSAQLSPDGIPQELVDEQNRIAETKRLDTERIKREIDRKRETSRNEKGRDVIKRERERRRSRSRSRGEYRRRYLPDEIFLTVNKNTT